MAQEALHSIKMKKLKGVILKINLSKAFDWSTSYISGRYSLIRWIMCCITLVSFAILINGSTSYSFRVERGLRQGCPLSPLLFLLFMEGLSRKIASKKSEGRLMGVKITNQCILTHLLFVDDILIFLDGGIHDINSFTRILR